MIILGFDPARSGLPTTPSKHPSHHLVLVFGLGMIGHAIVDGLYRLGFHRWLEVPYSWHDEHGRAASGTRIEAVCDELATQRNGRISVVWSAGRAGFHSTAAELQSENLAFGDTVGLIERLRRSLHGTPLDVHHLSSAGGLFEGQQVISHASRPAPLRPYGESKLAQERQLQERLKHCELTIYRPSSVYGPYFTGNRHGLINHLVANSRRGRVTVLDAHVMALRDYVFTGDIGQ